LLYINHLDYLRKFSYLKDMLLNYKSFPNKMNTNIYDSKFTTVIKSLFSFVNRKMRTLIQSKGAFKINSMI